MSILLIVWGIVTAALIVLLIYRSTLRMHEDDQLFLDQAESHMEKAQAENTTRINRTILPVRLLAVASGLLLLVIGAMWAYQGWTGGQ